MSAEYSLKLDGGKYTVRHTNGGNFHALRYGEPWRDLTGDGLMLALVQRIEELEANRIEADESAVPVGEVYVARGAWTLRGFRARMDSLQNGNHPVYLHPPAQVDADWRIGMFDRWRAAAQEKGYAGIAEAITAAPTAEPVAQGEAIAWMTPGGDVSRSYLWCSERCRDGQNPIPLGLITQPHSPDAADSGRVMDRAEEFTRELNRAGVACTRGNVRLALSALAAQGQGEAVDHRARAITERGRFEYALKALAPSLYEKIRDEVYRRPVGEDDHNEFAAWAGSLAAQGQGEAATLYVEARQCDNCDHLGLNDASETESACHNCYWHGPEPEEDKCPGCGSENCMYAACPECGNRYSFLADRHFPAPAASPVGVPDGLVSLARAVAHLRNHHVRWDEFGDMACDYVLAAAPSVTHEE